MKRLLAFALALTLFAAPAVALARTTNETVRVPGQAFEDWNKYLDSLAERGG